MESKRGRGHCQELQSTRWSIRSSVDHATCTHFLCLSGLGLERRCHKVTRHTHERSKTTNGGKGPKQQEQARTRRGGKVSTCKQRQKAQESKERASSNMLAIHTHLLRLSGLCPARSRHKVTRHTHERSKTPKEARPPNTMLCQTGLGVAPNRNKDDLYKLILQAPKHTKTHPHTHTFVATIRVRRGRNNCMVKGGKHTNKWQTSEKEDPQTADTTSNKQKQTQPEGTSQAAKTAGQINKEMARKKRQSKASRSQTNTHTHTFCVELSRAWLQTMTK